MEEQLSGKVVRTFSISKGFDDMLTEFAESKGTSKSEVVENFGTILFKVAKDDQDIDIELGLASVLSEQKQLLLKIFDAVTEEKKLVAERRDALRVQYEKRNTIMND